MVSLMIVENEVSLIVKIDRHNKKWISLNCFNYLILNIKLWNQLLLALLSFLFLGLKVGYCHMWKWLVYN